MAETLTTNLRLELEKTNVIFNKWSAKQRDWVDSKDADYDRQMEENDCTIKALQENDQQLEESRGVNESIKLQQKQEVDQITFENELLHKQKKTLELELKKSEECEEKESSRLEMIRVEHETLRNKMEQSLNDLTHGVRYYNSLGLAFQKSDGDCMKFVFTQIDPNDVAREFYFLMFVDANNQYQLVETNPQLDKSACAVFLGNLNTNNDIGKFVFHIRALFCNLIKMA